MKKIILLSIGCFLYILSYAGTIKGVLENDEGQTIAGASIQILNFNYQTSSNEKGTFEFSGIPAGNYILSIRYLGYRTEYIKVNILENDNIMLNVVLKFGVIKMNREIIISASRIQDKQFNLPYSANNISTQDMEDDAARTSPEALMKYGVWVQKTNHGGGSPFVRGLTGYHTLIMIDGIRLNNSIFRSGPNQYVNTIDPLSIGNIEIVRSTGSTQYGSDALGGTIQYFSKKPQFGKGDILSVKPSVYYKYASQALNSTNNNLKNYFFPGMENIVHVELNIANKRIAFLGGYSHKVFNDIDAAASIGKLKPNAYNEFDFDIKLVSRIVNRQFLTLSFQKVKQQNIPLYHKIASGAYSTYSFDPQGRILTYLRHEIYLGKAWFRKITTSFSYQNTLEVRKKQKTDDITRTKEKDIAYVYGFSTELYSTPTDFWKISTGIEYYHDDIKSQTKISLPDETRIARGLYPDNSTFDNFAVFTLHSLDFKKWNIQTGIRYNSYKLLVKDTLLGNVVLNPAALVGNLGVSFKINKSYRIVVSANSGFRTPNINDVSSFGIADFRYEVPSAGLKPEKSITYELGLKQKNKFMTSSVFLFSTRLYDLITNTKTNYRGNDSVLVNEKTGEYIYYYHKENTNRAKILGFEAQTEIQITRNFSGIVRLFYTFGQDITTNSPMRRIPPLNGILGLKWNKQQGGWIKLEYIFALKQDRLSSGDISDSRIAKGGTPAWDVFNISAGFQIKKWLRVNGRLNNIFDKAYRLHGSGVDAYGRNFQLSLKFGK